MSLQTLVDELVATEICDYASPATYARMHRVSTENAKLLIHLAVSKNGTDMTRDDKVDNMWERLYKIEQDVARLVNLQNGITENES